MNSMGDEERRDSEGSNVNGMISEERSLVRVEGLRKYFPIYGGVLRKKVAEVRAVDGVSFSVPKGETFGLVGESGSGKTTTARTMLRIENPTGGRVEIDGRDVFGLSISELKKFRKNMQMVFQDPTSSLNPRKRVKEIIKQPMKIHDVGGSVERNEKVEKLMEIVGLPKEYMYKYPTALSGGQRQRTGIARALSLNPKFVILDEPTSALDVSVQARIVDLLDDLQERFDLTYLFISHDLSLVKSVSDWIGVMYLGRLVDVGAAEKVFRKLDHPYTKTLLSAIPTVSDSEEEMKPTYEEVEGGVPDPREKPRGCAFRSRCPEEIDLCGEEEPPLCKVGDRHFVRCHLQIGG